MLKDEQLARGRIRARRYRERHRDRVRDALRRCRAKPEVKAKIQAWTAQNRERIREYQARYRSKPEVRAKAHAYNREYLKQHPQSQESKASNREKQRMLRHQIKLRIVALMGNRCWRCGWAEHMFGLEFDHKDPLQKQHVPSDLISRTAHSTKAEQYITANCTMLCANCHALKTVAYGDNLRGNNISDTTKERQLFESVPVIDPRC